MDFQEFLSRYQKKIVKTYNDAVGKTPVVSVCVVTFQHKNFIKDCLNGILMQETSFPFEILLGEDDSTDGTREICKEYAQKFPDKIRLFLHHRENNIKINGNPTGRFNFMYNLYSAKGKYIALCEGDDYWTDPLKLQKQIDLLKGNIDLIGCHHWQKLAIKEKDIFVEVDAPKTGHGYFSQRVSTVKNIIANQVRVKTRTLLFRNIIDQDFFPSWFCKVAFGDVPLSFLLGKHGDFGFIDEPMAVYRITGEGISTAGLKELGEQKFKVQHFKNWVQIWDYAEILYKFKYHREASQTVLGFFKIIVNSLPVSASSFAKVLSYNIFKRRLPLNSKIGTSKWIIHYYLKILWHKWRRKFSNS